MKITKLKFMNLNSLAGVTTIDFAVPAYNDGLFLIAGDTGAGKTTILDAVTLALFGETPRTSISETSNEVMTRGESKCMSEVEFAVESGLYRATWGQARTKRKDAKKAFGDATHRLAKWNGTAWIEESGTRTEILKKLKTLVGVEDFNQYLRTAMLAQGQFGKFLEANGKDDTTERAKILEQATGTEIYAQIGMEIADVYRRMKNEKDALDEQCKGAELQLLSDGELQAKRERLDGLESIEKELTAKKSLLELEDKWHKDDAALAKRKAEIDAAAEQLDKDWLIFGSDSQRLAEAEKALKLTVKAQELATAEQTAAKAQNNAAAMAAELPELEAALKRAESAAQTAKSAAAKACAERSEAEPKIVYAEQLDHELASMRERTKALRKEAAKLNAEVEAMGREKSSAETAAELAAQKAAACLAEANKPHPEADAAKLKAANLKSELEQAVAAHVEVEQEKQLRAEDLDRAIEAADLAWRAVREVMDYENRRKLLHDGEPCPLCGAMEHPYCLGAPEEDAAKLALIAAKAEKQDLDKRVDAAQKRLNAAVAAEKSAAEEYENLRRRLEQEANDLLTKAVRLEMEAKGKREQAQGLVDKIEAATIALARSRAEAEASEKELTAKEAERNALGMENPADFRTRLEARRMSALAEESRTKVALAKAHAELENGRKNHDAALADADAAAKAAVAADAEFGGWCREAGFADREDWRRACWTESEVERARRMRDDLNRRRTEMQTRLDDWSADMAEFELRTKPERPAATAEAELADAMASLAAAHDEAVATKESLGSDAERRRNLEGLAAKRQCAAVELEKWKDMNTEFGTNGGKNLQRFAQSITLSRLIEEGNLYLVPMTNGRYEMKWNADGEDLLPVVVDRRSGGEERPVRNMSGGEKFQLSLALALGLSRLNAGKLHVETLFLDEGFGTLDEKALDMAIGTLEGVQRDGKTIGIISHVRELAERLATKIEVSKKGNGRSEISGPGVTFERTI